MTESGVVYVDLAGRKGMIARSVWYGLQRVPSNVRRRMKSMEEGETHSHGSKMRRGMEGTW
jgi:hypothetical protein